MQCKLSRLDFDMSKCSSTYSFLTVGCFCLLYLCLSDLWGVLLLFFFSVCPMWKLKSPSCPLLTKLRKLSTDVTNVTKIAISLGEFSTAKSELTGNCPAHMVSTSKRKVLLQEKWFFCCCCCYLAGGEGEQHKSNTKKPCGLNSSFLEGFLFAYFLLCPCVTPNNSQVKKICY